MHVRSSHNKGRHYENENEIIIWDREPKTDEDAINLASKIVEYFNNTLRPNEIPRELVSVKKFGDIIFYRNNIPEL